MKKATSEDPIVDFDIRVCRDDGKETKRLQLFITVWIAQSNLEIQDVTIEDLLHTTINKETENEVGILQLDVHVATIPEKESKPLKKPVGISKLIEITDDSKTTLKYDEDLNSMFLVSIFPPSRPTGTKRRVIVYEDADIIDDTKV